MSAVPNLLQSTVALCVLAAAMLALGFWQGCEHGRRAVTTAYDAEVAHAQERSRLAADAAKEAIAAAQEEADRAEALRAERDSLDVLLRFATQEADAARTRSADANARAERDLAAFEKNRGDSLKSPEALKASCSDALTSCTEARAALNATVAALSESLTRSAEVRAVQAREIDALTVSNDSLFAAAGHLGRALSAEREATQAALRKAGSLQRERDVWRVLAPVGAAVGFVVGVLIK